MEAKWIVLGVLVAASCLVVATGARGEDAKDRVVRIAELEIDPAQLVEYNAALKRAIDSSIREEPGVLMLYAVSVKGHPEQIRIFEMYASQAAYEAHLQTDHFKRYKTETQGMVRSLKLVQTETLVAGSKLR